jgi:hypothetical protein
MKTSLQKQKARPKARPPQELFLFTNSIFQAYQIDQGKVDNFQTLYSPSSQSLEGNWSLSPS